MAKYGTYASIRAGGVADFIEWVEARGVRLMRVDNGEPYGANWFDLASEWINQNELASDEDKEMALLRLRSGRTAG